MIDIALKTAEAGYLTRRLVEAVQGVIINSPDCGTKDGILVTEEEETLQAQKIYGRYLSKDVENKKKEIILKSGILLLSEEIQTIQTNQISAVWVRSPLTCKIAHSLCQKCYGVDLSRLSETISLGTAAGIIAAQSLGEP